VSDVRLTMSFHVTTQIDDVKRLEKEIAFRIISDCDLIINLTMGWQTTFTLSKHAKGCYLVTDEVVKHIQPGLKGVEASPT
jgi:hypothetical protein